MDEALLEIKDYRGEGYQPLINFNSWRVAILRWEPSLLPGNIERMERHLQTDEVFVLLQGQATLILGGNGEGVDRVDPQVMQVGKLYHVKQAAWHTILLSRDASILIVENRDTGVDNSEYCPLSQEYREDIWNIS